MAGKIASVLIVVLAGAFGAACISVFFFSLHDAPCRGEDLDECLNTQDELLSVAGESCDGEGRRLCLVPLGLVSTELMLHLTDHYQDEYGIEVTVLTPLSVAPYIVDEEREQIGGTDLIEYMVERFPDAAGDPDAVMIGVTPIDLFFEERSNWRFAFGARGTPEHPKAVVSTFRMNPETFGRRPDDEVLFSRARKMVSKYVGLLYFRLEENPDPESPLYDSILSVRDLDRMGEPLPVAR